jgi:hypothetical protein
MSVLGLRWLFDKPASIPDTHMTVRHSAGIDHGEIVIDVAMIDACSHAA